MKILLLEDNARLNATIVKRLEAKAYSVDSFIDGQEAYVGGFNVGDEYLGKNKKFGYWRDTQLKIEGDIIDSIEAEFLMDWLFVKKQKISKDFETDKYFPKREPTGSIDMQICSSGPNYDHPYIKDSIIKLISKAKKSIYMTIQRILSF